MSGVTFKQNLWMNGITGERITALRESEIYSTSSRDIQNLFVTELGNLSCAKKMNVRVTNTGSIIDLIETKFGFYLAITETSIFKFNTITHDQIGTELAHGIVGATNLNNISIVDKYLFISFKEKSKVFDIENAVMTETNFLQTISLPIEKKKNMTIDIYRRFSATVGATTVTQLNLVYTDSDPELSSNGTGQILVPGRNAILKRLYKDFKSALEEDSVTIAGIEVGDYVGVFRRYRENTDEAKMIINNTEVVFGDKITDPTYGGDYFTTMKAVNGTVEVPGGNLFYGKLVDITVDIIDTGIMQGRMYLLTEDRLFFSRTFDYNDFRNGSDTEDPFYIQPSPINGIAPILLKCKSGIGLFVLSDRGVYLIGYNKVLTPTSIIVNTASDTPATKESQLVDGTLFFISNSQKLMALQESSEKVSDTFYTFFVEKFDLKDEFEYLMKGLVNNRQVLVGVKKNDSEFVYVYDTKGTNEFRKTRIVADWSDDITAEKTFAVRDTYITKNVIAELSKNNVPYCQLLMSPPLTETKKGGTLLNDASAKITRVALKVINSNANAIKGVTLAGRQVSKVGSNLEDTFSIYDAKCQIPLNNGYEIVITTNENTEILEILGVEVWLDLPGI